MKFKEFIKKRKILVIFVASILVVAIASSIISITAYRKYSEDKTANTGNIFNQKIKVDREANSSHLRYKKSGKNIIILGFKEDTPDYTLLSIPDTIDGKPVAQIAPEAFINNSFIETVIFGSNVTTIGASAFENCTSLKSTAFKSNTTTIESKAFNGCTNLKAISLNDGLLSLGDGCFKNTALTVIYVPESVKSILNSFPDGITVTGAVNTYAEDWANENHFRFKEIN